MKYIIELNPDCVDGEFLWMPIRIAGEDQWIKTKASLTPYTEPDRNAIEAEVWEFASMLMNMHPDVAEDIYWSMNGGKGIGVAAEMTYQEAKSKYEAWKKHKDEIHVGDEVTLTNGRTTSVVIGFCYGSANLLYKNGDVGQYPKDGCQKTGKHFDEVAELLEKLRGKEE